MSSAGVPIRRGAPFGDRRRAGQLLADELAAMQLFDPIVVALPLGGVPVGREIAARLGAPLEVFGVRKLAHPGRPEFGFGAIAEDGTRLVDPESARVLGLHNGEVDRITAREREELRRRVDLYRDGRPVPDVVTLRIPAHFRGVGDSYLDFRQVSDEEVLDALAGPARAAA